MQEPVQTPVNQGLENTTQAQHTSIIFTSETRVTGNKEAFCTSGIRRSACKLKTPSYPCVLQRKHVFLFVNTRTHITRRNKMKGENRVSHLWQDFCIKHAPPEALIFIETTFLISMIMVTVFSHFQFSSRIFLLKQVFVFICINQRCLYYRSSLFMFSMNISSSFQTCVALGILIKHNQSLEYLMIMAFQLMFINKAYLKFALCLRIHMYSHISYLHVTQT